LRCPPAPTPPFPGRNARILRRTPRLSGIDREIGVRIDPTELFERERFDPERPVAVGIIEGQPDRVLSRLQPGRRAEERDGFLFVGQINRDAIEELPVDLDGDREEVVGGVIEGDAEVDAEPMDAGFLHGDHEIERSLHRLADGGPILGAPLAEAGTAGGTRQGAHHPDDRDIRHGRVGIIEAPGVSQ